MNIINLGGVQSNREYTFDDKWSEIIINKLVGDGSGGGCAAAANLYISSRSVVLCRDFFNWLELWRSFVTWPAIAKMHICHKSTLGHWQPCPQTVQLTIQQSSQQVRCSACRRQNEPTPKWRTPGCRQESLLQYGTNWLIDQCGLVRKGHQLSRAGRTLPKCHLSR